MRVAKQVDDAQVGPYPHVSLTQARNPRKLGPPSVTVAIQLPNARRRSALWKPRSVERSLLSRRRSCTSRPRNAMSCAARTAGGAGCVRWNSTPWSQLSEVMGALERHPDADASLNRCVDRRATIEDLIGELATSRWQGEASIGWRPFSRCNRHPLTLACAILFRCDP